MTCKQPSFAQGSSRLLSFAKKKTEAPAATAAAKPQAAVWSLDDMADDDVDFVNEDDLLDEDDKTRPDPASLRGEIDRLLFLFMVCIRHNFVPVCGTTGKRKACKDCSCGLREELEAGKPAQKKDVTSSCGSVSQARKWQIFYSKGS